MTISQSSAYRQSTASKQRKVEIQPQWGLHQPSEYSTLYPRMPEVTQKDLRYVFGTGEHTHSVPLVARRPVELLPNMRSFDPRVIEFLRTLSERLNRALPAKVDDLGFSTNGIHTTFDRLKCVAGYEMNPISYIPVDNERYRQELGLKPGYTPRQRAIAEEMWNIVWSEAKTAPVNVPKLSTSGMRRFTFDVQWKLDYAQMVLQPDQLHKVLAAVDRRDAHALANDHEMVVAMMTQKRGQVDEPGKVRTVFDLDYALSGGAKGRSFAADKKVEINGTHYPDFSAVRVRVISAGPWTVNAILQVPATTAMHSLFVRFPNVFHVNTPEQIKAQVEGKHVFCSDVSDYDRSMSRDALLVAHEVAKKYWDPRLVDLSWRLYTSPYYARPLKLDEKRGVWVKNPMDWSEEVMAGNRSGHAWTSLMAKVNKVIETMFIVDTIQPLLGRVREFLNGQLLIQCVNNGDDEIVTTTEANVMAKFRKARANKELGHYIVDAELGQGYSGQLLVRTGPVSYQPQPRLQTTFEKMYVPERSIGGKHRRYWPIGVLARIENITASDAGREAWAIHMATYRELLAPHYGDIMELLHRAVSEMDISIDSLSPIDKEVLISPDRLHYKYSRDEVSGEVLQKITSKIPIEAVANVLRHFYKGNVA